MSVPLRLFCRAFSTQRAMRAIGQASSAACPTAECRTLGSGARQHRTLDGMRHTRHLWTRPGEWDCCRWNSYAAAAAAHAATQGHRHTRPHFACLCLHPGVLLASGSTSPSAAAVTPDTKVAAAISAACEQLGKPFPAAAVQALESNWYSTAAELAALPEETARSLGVPLRLKTAVADMLSSRSAPPTAAPAAARGAAAAVSGQQQAAQPPGSAKGFLSSAMQYFGSLMQPDGAARDEPPAAARPASQQQPAAAGNSLDGASRQPPTASRSRQRPSKVAHRSSLDAGAVTVTATSQGSSSSSSSSLEEMAKAAVSSSLNSADLPMASLPQHSSSSSLGSTLPAVISGEVSWAALPIEERRSQKMARFNNPFSSAEKVSKRTKPERYAISVRACGCWPLPL